MHGFTSGCHGGAGARMLFRICFRHSIFGLFFVCCCCIERKSKMNLVCEIGHLTQESSPGRVLLGGLSDFDLFEEGRYTLDAGWSEDENRP